MSQDQAKAAIEATTEALRAGGLIEGENVGEGDGLSVVAPVYVDRLEQAQILPLIGGPSVAAVLGALDAADLVYEVVDLRSAGHTPWAIYVEAPAPEVVVDDEIPVEDDGHADEFVEVHAPQAHPAIIGIGGAAAVTPTREMYMRQQDALEAAQASARSGFGVEAIVGAYLRSMRESEPPTPPSESVEESR